MLASLGSATHTRVDSAAKHIRQCKIHERLMSLWHGDPDPEAMHRQKNRYATVKDDLVLNVNESLGKTCTPTEAYPSVMSNFTSMCPEVQRKIIEWYSKKTPVEFFMYYNEIYEDRQTGMKNIPANQLKTLPFFRAQGYALGRAEAHMRSGDTVFSVMIGGQMTVTNGHFPMRPGQMVQWYFEFENVKFDKDGRRHTHTENTHTLKRADKRALDEINAESTCRALPKPFVLGTDGSENYGDKIRIFAKCICGGPAFQKVDIMMMTQSL
jgi:hypothetical protein